MRSDVSFSLSILIAGQSEKIMTVMYPNWAVVKTQRRKEIQSWMGFEPLASPVPVQCSYHWDLEPTRSWSLCEFVVHVYPRKMKVGIWNLMYIWTVGARKRKAGVVHLGCFLRSAVWRPLYCLIFQLSKLVHSTTVKLFADYEIKRRAQEEKDAELRWAALRARLFETAEKWN